jgi:alpha-tubulin suppressor-like RCC1 family protein
VAAGHAHTVVVLSNGRALSCGKNDYGQLGVEAATSRGTLGLIPLAYCSGEGAADGGGTRVVQVSCGYYHTVLVTSSGGLRACGRNDYGQLGLGHCIQKVHGRQG